MTTSGYIASLPSINTTARNCGSVEAHADRFRRVLREQNDRALKALPLAGSARAIRAKVDGSIRISIDETAAILRVARDEEAVDLLRALSEDAGKQASVDVRLNAVPVLETADVPCVEREFSLLFSRFLAAADDLTQKPQLARSLEAKRLRNLEIGLESRARALVNAVDRDDS